VGQGPEMIEVKRLAKELGVYSKILFLGNTTEVSKILCYSDVFLLPSEAESFGLAALEAMAAKTPIISSNTGGLPEVNVHGVSGFLSNVGDIEDMTKNALTILKDDDVLATFKTNAKKIADGFDIHEIVPVYEDIYRQALVNCVSV